MISLRDNVGRTALMMACEQSHHGVFNALLEQHALLKVNVNQRLETGETRLPVTSVRCIGATAHDSITCDVSDRHGRHRRSHEPNLTWRVADDNTEISKDATRE